jgi:hypothetical protein
VRSTFSPPSSMLSKIQRNLSRKNYQYNFSRKNDSATSARALHVPRPSNPRPLIVQPSRYQAHPVKELSSPISTESPEIACPQQCCHLFRGRKIPFWSAASKPTNSTSVRMLCVDQCQPDLPTPHFLPYWKNHPLPRAHSFTCLMATINQSVQVLDTFVVGSEGKK